MNCNCVYCKYSPNTYTHEDGTPAHYFKHDKRHTYMHTSWIRKVWHVIRMGKGWLDC